MNTASPLFFVIGIPVMFLIGHGVCSFIVYKVTKIKLFPWWGTDYRNY